MADTKMRIKIRRDISTKWTDINPKLLSGEQGFEVDTGKMKIGDGSSRWNTLPYFGNDISQSQGTILTTRIDLLDSSINKLKKLQVYSDAEELKTQDQATNILVDSIFDTKDKLDEAILKVNIKIDNTRTELLSAVSNIRKDVNQTVSDLTILKNETVAEIQEEVEAFDAKKLPTNLTSLPSL